MKLQSWVEVPEHSDFSLYNIPFGIIQYGELPPRVATAIGDYAVDLCVLYERGYFDAELLDVNYFDSYILNPFIGLGKEITSKVRLHIQNLLSTNENRLREDQGTRDIAFIPLKEVGMQMPVFIPNYTDFYSSIEHATNVGTMFRDPENALLPNWKHLPVGYHGRSSSIVPSGIPLHRPKGQQISGDAETPVFGPSKLVDFELEMAFITNTNTTLGDSISVNEAEDYIFGMVLFNDWSARDIQKWEYVPLGPFLAKNFGSSISPWVVTLEALEPFRMESPKQDPKVLPYLQYKGEKNFDIRLQVAIQPKNSEETVVCNSNFKYMYWNMSQQLAHHTVNGCNIEVGDLYASGTISGKTPDSYGSMLELAWRGTKPLKLKDGSERKFINDYDTVIMRGHCENETIRVGFGEVKTQLLPAKD